MTRQRSLRGIQRDEGLRPRSQALKAAHPCWGYRRSWAYLHVLERLPVNKKRLWRLMRAQYLLVTPTLRRNAKRTPPRSQPRPSQPHEWGAST